MLLLAACGQSDETSADPAVPEQEVAETAEETSADKPAESSANAEVDAPTDTPEPAAKDIAPNLIPAAFHGTWDYTKGTCADESDLRMEVSEGQIIFYESVGQVRSIKAKDEMTLDVTLAMEGEGEVWTNVTRLVLSDDGAILTPSAGPDEQAYEAMPR
ncbi:MAG: hypothetical protein ABJH26_04390, partial [Marinomonas sp.]